MKKIMAFAVLALFVAQFALAEDGARPGAAVIGTVTVTAKVKSIDYKTRQVTLQKEDGSLQTLKVGEAARNFNQVIEGDNVTFTYTEALALDVRKAEGELEEKAELNVNRVPLGEKPAGFITGSYTIKALVDEIDYTTRSVTLKGPEGNKLTMKVGEQAKRFNEVKKGDHVVVHYTEALGISVTPKG